MYKIGARCAELELRRETAAVGIACFFDFVGASLPHPSKAQTARADWTIDGPRFYAGSRRSKRTGRAVRSSRRADRRVRRRYNYRLVRSNQRRKKPLAQATALPQRRTDPGPIQVVVSVDKQKLSVYEAGRLVGASPVSTGQDGFETPTGVFSIIQKKRRHYSNIYHGASMPFMQRLTWSGIALHQGVVPGYRASHGCVRLPGSFARQLFRYTRRRNHVIVADGDPQPRQVRHPLLFQPTAAEARRRQDTADSQRRTVWLASNEFGAAISKTDAQPMAAVAKVAPAQKAVVVTEPVSPVTPPGHVYYQFDRLDLENERLMLRLGKSNAPLRILITRRTERDHIRDTQRWLAVLGYYTGPLDGLVGKQTIMAIKSFESDKGLAVTGYLNPPLQRELRRATACENLYEGILRVRQNGKEIYSAHVQLADRQKQIGTHLFTLVGMNGTAGAARWAGMTVKSAPHASFRLTRARSNVRSNVAAMTQALDRIAIPRQVTLAIEDFLTPGTSMIVTDGGYDRETGIDTDFVVLTD